MYFDDMCCAVVGESRGRSPSISPDASGDSPWSTIFTPHWRQPTPVGVVAVADIESGRVDLSVTQPPLNSFVAMPSSSMRTPECGVDVSKEKVSRTIFWNKLIYFLSKIRQFGKGSAIKLFVGVLFIHLPQRRFLHLRFGMNERVQRTNQK
eukprot:PhM_4_TR350/c0_g1_i1/m.71516